TRYLWESSKYRRGGLVVRAPNADLGRDPRWGRTEECFGEDPFLNGVMAVAMTRGLQGDHPRYLQCASLLKHFLANSNENDRTKSSSNFDARLFHEYYSVPFRMAIQEGDAQGVMAAYNAVNGVPCHVNPFLKNVLMKKYGHDGIICTDGRGLNLLVSDHQWRKELSAASAVIIQAGINQFLNRHDLAVREALHQKLLTEAEMDGPLRGVFRVMIRLGQLDPPSLVPYKKVGKKEPWESPEHRALAFLAAQKSVVLLRNEGEFLPCDAKSVRSVAVIGPYADKVIADWYGGDAPYLVSPLEGIKKRLGKKVKVKFVRDNQGRQAEKLARSCDMVVVCVGNHPVANGGWAKRDSPAEGKEALDRDSLKLRHEDMVKKILKANPRTVVVIQGNFPFTMGWTARHAPVILHLTHSGQEIGTALAGAVFGDFNPGGRLVQTWPRSMKDLPPMMDYDIRRGRTYMYFKGEPLYPFGYGLSYTSFDYSSLKLSSPNLKPNGNLTVTLTIRNTGSRDGDEVVQVYVAFPDSKVKRPLKQLKAFQRVAVAAGQAKVVKLTLRAKDLAYWKGRSTNVANGGWKVEPGRVQILVGSSSADIRLKGGFKVVK
ncbi:MAG TPA: glycoside hydrolase family 3 C-terminal domain-containing protein, partial [bacterium]